MKPSGGRAERTALLLAAEPPYPLNGGGAWRSASLVEYLASRYELDVIVFRQPGAPDPAASFPPGRARRVAVVPLCIHSRSVPARAGRNLLRFLRGVPPLNGRYAGYAGLIREALKDRQYDVAVVEHFWCAPYVEQIAGLCRHCVVDLHNIDSVLYARTAATERLPEAWLFRRFAAAAERMERRWLPEFQTVLVTSENDRSEVLRLSPASRAHVYPNAISAVTPLARSRPGESIVFSGNLEYWPNRSAIRYFHRLIWPRLRAQRPSLVWRVVGRNAADAARELRGDSRIQVVGEVDDAVRELARAKVAIVPLLAGSGTRIKILEAWAASVPVVSTSLGAEGLDARNGEHLLLADTPEEFAGCVLRLLDSDSLREQLAAAARVLFEEKYTWPAAWRTLAPTGI